MTIGSFWTAEYAKLNQALKRLSLEAVNKAGIKTNPAFVADEDPSRRLESAYSRLITDRLTNAPGSPLYQDSDAITIVAQLELPDKDTVAGLKLADGIIRSTMITIGGADANPRIAYNKIGSAIKAVAAANNITVTQVIESKTHRAEVIKRCMNRDSWIRVMLRQTHNLELARDSAGILDDLTYGLSDTDQYRIRIYMHANCSRQLSQLIRDYTLAIKNYYVTRANEIWPS